MANNKSALKRIRQTKRRTERNKTLKTKVKTLRKRTMDAAESGKADEAQAELKKFSSVVDRSVKKNLMHRNKAANMKRKASKALKASAVAS